MSCHLTSGSLPMSHIDPGRASTAARSRSPSVLIRPSLTRMVGAYSSAGDLNPSGSSDQSRYQPNPRRSARSCVTGNRPLPTPNRCRRVYSPLLIVAGGHGVKTGGGAARVDESGAWIGAGLALVGGGVGNDVVVGGGGTIGSVDGIGAGVAGDVRASRGSRGSAAC